MNSPALTDRIKRFPGWEIVGQGLADVAAGRVSAMACTVWIALPRLQSAGLIDLTHLDRRIPEPESELYRLLCREPGDAYGRYQSILRRLVRFEHALDRETFSRTN